MIFIINYIVNRVDFPGNGKGGIYMDNNDCKVLDKIQEIYENLLSHDGYGEFKVEMKLMKRGQKEVIIHCGKQYRYVVDWQ